jgi:hypothetical protein
MNDPWYYAFNLFYDPGVYNARRFSGIPVSVAWFGIVCGFGDRVVGGETWKQNADLWLGQLDYNATTTVASGSNGAVLPQSTINVASTAGFPTFGKLLIQNQVLDYTGITGTSFTGCTGGTATLATGNSVARAISGPFWDATKSWTLHGYTESDGVTKKSTIVLYMIAILSYRILRLCEVLPPSANVTKAKNMIRTSCDWLRVNSGLLYTSPTAYPYATTEVFYPDGTIIDVNGTPTDISRTTVYGAGTAAELDLSALFSHMFAWRGYEDNSAADIAHAKLLYSTTGLTPRNGAAGPYIGEHSTSAKQWDEAFYTSQNVPAYVELYEAL